MGDFISGGYDTINDKSFQSVKKWWNGLTEYEKKTIEIELDEYDECSECIIGELLCKINDLPINKEEIFDFILGVDECKNGKFSIN